MMFTSGWLSHIFTDHQLADESQSIEQVTTDSRVKTNSSLFIPIIGEHFNGHDFAEQAVENGAVALLWDSSHQVPDRIGNHVSVFFVEDTLKAMQELATKYRDVVDPIVIGITGSNGKTTTKDLVSQVAGSTFRTHHTYGNLNNDIGMPLTILNMAPRTQVLILEMGMNHFGEIERLSRIAKPDYAIITNIGESHIEFLGSRKGISQAKREILIGMEHEGTILIDGDEPLLSDIKNISHVIKCGFNDDNDVIVGNPVYEGQIMRFTLSNGQTFSIPLLGKHNALNATFAITIGRLLGIDDTEIINALKTTEHTAMRFEMKSGPSGVSLVNDAYNASPTSMKAAIDVVKQLPGYKEKVLVLGDILELGDDSEAFHRSVAQVIDNEITAVYTYGNESKAIIDCLQERTQSITVKHFNTKEALITQLHSHLKVDTIILFKASRKMQFETIVDSLQAFD